MKEVIVFLFSLFSVVTSLAVGCPSNVEVCFTPGQHCTEKIVESINDAKHQLLVQAYSFTSAPIAKAIINAHRRGIDVQIILDKSQISQRYSSATFFENQKIPLWVDYKVAIAHNKVIIIDSSRTIGGSFNYSKAAQTKNAENVLFIDSACLAQQFEQNWKKRQAVSTPIELYRENHKKV